MSRAQKFINKSEARLQKRSISFTLATDADDKAMKKVMGDMEAQLKTLSGDMGFEVERVKVKMT